MSTCCNQYYHINILYQALPLTSVVEDGKEHPQITKRRRGEGRCQQQRLDEPRQYHGCCYYEQRNKSISDEDILQACLRFLDCDLDHFKQLWCWDKLFAISKRSPQSPTTEPWKGKTVHNNRQTPPKTNTWLMSANLSDYSRYK